MQLRFAYGRGEQPAEVADERVIEQIALPSPEGVEDVSAALEDSLDHPVGPRLDEVIAAGDHVAVMTVDFTRPNPSSILWHLIERIEDLGASWEIVIGLGNHRPMTEAELDDFIGFHDVLQPDSKGPQWKLGATDHGTPIEVAPFLRDFNKRVACGFIEPSYIAGFSGGRKMILPGVSSARSISRNHFLTLTEGRKLGVLDGNPVHEDMTQAALAVGVDFICDAVINPDDSYAEIVCGDMIQAHRRGAEHSRRIYEHTVRRKADIVICTSGGWPYDVDMVQAKKTLVPALECVRPGGAVILLGECERGWGAVPPLRSLLEGEDPPALIAEMRRRLADGETEWQWAPCSTGLMFSSVVHEREAQLIVVSEKNDELKDTFADTAPDLPAALALAEERLGPDASIIALHDGRRVICTG
ncbi:MAG: nickel-dependent lactate racemase [Armatimonadetes bacterium]|nr:nickel-dependent lactate racemase [Armatimonadota bacterium]